MRAIASLVRRSAVMVATALVLAACAAEPPANPFVGAWTTAERQQISVRDNTVVMQPAGAAPTPMAADSCDGVFRFGYAQRSRDALLGLTPRQPDLKRRLSSMLVKADYPVAELNCGEGASTYVLLDDRDVVVIHRDRDIGGIEKLTRL